MLSIFLLTSFFIRAALCICFLSKACRLSKYFYKDDTYEKDPEIIPLLVLLSCLPIFGWYMIYLLFVCCYRKLFSQWNEMKHMPDAATVKLSAHEFWKYYSLFPDRWHIDNDFLCIEFARGKASIPVKFNSFYDYLKASHKYFKKQYENKKAENKKASLSLKKDFYNQILQEVKTKKEKLAVSDAEKDMDKFMNDTKTILAVDMNRCSEFLFEIENSILKKDSNK